MTRIDTFAVILDLDDTLYLERDYVRSGFEAVGRVVAEKCGVVDFASRCWSHFEQGVRGTTFDKVLQELGLCGVLEQSELVEVYRAHVPCIQLAQDARTFLNVWPKDRPLGLITDGPLVSQSAKIAALELRTTLHPIILSDSFGTAFRKPHEKPFIAVEQALALGPRQLTYIADNPRKDFAAPKRRGWSTIRIRRPLGEHSASDDTSDCSADSEIVSFEDLRW